MTTKKEMIEIIESENPTLRLGDEENGYTELTGTNYDAVISEWADARLAKLQEQASVDAEADAKAQAKATAEGKLAALGLTTDDLMALGL
jgi:hypothetical protein